MKIQFSTKTIFLIIASVAITLGGALAWRGIVLEYQVRSMMDLNVVPPILVYIAPFVVPLMFTAYLIGQRTITPALTLTFAAVEAGSLGAATWIFHHV